MVVECLEDPFIQPQALGLNLLQQPASGLASSSSPATSKVKGRGQGKEMKGGTNPVHISLRKFDLNDSAFASGSAQKLAPSILRNGFNRNLSESYNSLFHIPPSMLTLWMVLMPEDYIIHMLPFIIQRESTPPLPHLNDSLCSQLATEDGALHASEVLLLGVVP